MKYVIDAYSWADYFEGSLAGQQVKQIIENPENEIITNILNLAEISSFLSRKNSDTEEPFKIIFSLSKIYNFDSDFSKKAGIMHSEIRKKIKNFGLIDAFVLLTAEKIGGKIVTGDEHFKNFKNVVFIK